MQKTHEFSSRCIFKKRISNNYWNFCYSFNNHVYFLHDWKIEIEHLDTFEKDGRLYYRFVVNRNSRLRSSILQDRISDIGKIKPITREINRKFSSR